MADSAPPPAHSAGLYRASMFDAGAWLARIFPLGLLRALAGSAGWLYAITHPARVNVVLGNLRLLDPALTSATARRVYSEFGKTMADYFFIGTRSCSEAVNIIGQIDGEEYLRTAQAGGKGALILTAHFGLFELGGLLLGNHGFPGAVLTYPEPSEALTRWRAEFRRRWGADTLEVGADSFAFMAIAQCFRASKFVAALIDRPHANDSTPVTLPGGASAFSAGILLLAAHSGVPVIPATMVRRDDGLYHAQIFPPFLVEPRASREETLRVYAQQVADTFAPVLCKYPAQWYQFVSVTA